MAIKKTDYAHDLTYHPNSRMETLKKMSLPERSAVFSNLSPYVQQSILKQLKNSEIVEMLDHMDMQLAEHILTRISDLKRREKIVQKLKGDVKEKVEVFLRFHPKATLSLINFNYLFLDADLTIGKAADIIDEHYKETARFPEVLVHENGQLIGEVPISAMVKERNSNTLRRYVQQVKTVTYQSEVTDIIEMFVSLDCKKVIVLDKDTSVLGIVYVDAARQLFGNLPAESLYEFAGVDNSEKPFDSVTNKVKNRYQWLILNLATCFLAGSVILAFQDTLNTLTILSVYIPIVAGMGGNAAAQSFAIMVRGITLGTVSFETAKPAIKREFLAGIVNGIIIGSIVSIISTIWNGVPLLGLVVGLALVSAHIIAALAGSTIPLVMKHLGKDPAATSTIFISTVTDVFGILFLLGFATLFLL